MILKKEADWRKGRRGRFVIYTDIVGWETGREYFI
jgi:hypothetical protein